MKTFEVSLDILSSVPLVELERMFGIAADDGSHSAGDKSATGSPWKTSRLRVDSEVAEDAPVAAHVQALLARVPDRELPAEMQLVLTIAVFTDSPMSSVVLDVGEVRRVADRGWMVKVVTYFTDFTTQRRPTIQRLLRLVRAVRAWRAHGVVAGGVKAARPTFSRQSCLSSGERPELGFRRFRQRVRITTIAGIAVIGIR